MFDMNTGSIIKAGVSMLLYLFLVLVIYFILSSPLDTLFDNFDDLDAAEATDEMNEYLPNIITSLDIFFALIIAAPITGFIVWVFSREPDWSYRRRIR